MQTYRVKLTGTQPMIHHKDDIEWSDEMDAWKTDKDNLASSKPGDDRTPAYRWIGHMYRNEAGHIIVPTENLMRALMEAGAMILVGKGKKTFKAQSQSGILPRVLGWPLLVSGKAIDARPVNALLREKDFKKHKEAALEMGFELFVKRAKPPGARGKHVRVRPLFRQWSAIGELVVSDEQITAKILADLLERAGKFKGLGDWRPSAPTSPGIYGTFTAEIAAA